MGWLDNQLKYFFNRADDYFSEDDKVIIKQKNEEISSLKNNLNDCSSDRRELVDENRKYFEELNYLIKERDRLLDELEEYNSKPVDIPSADITYRRPFLIGKDNWGWTLVDVKNFIAPNFKIRAGVKNYTYDGTQDLDELIPKLYRLAKSNYKYGNDSNYGFEELWLMPWETAALLKLGKGVDCEEWSNWIGTHFAAANIPRDRWLVSCGYARNGIGHSTFYSKASDGNWYHLNSTLPDKRLSNLKKYPSNKDESDYIGIREGGFWFSYNDRFSIHKFDTEEAKTSFSRNKISERIEIKKKVGL